MDMKFPVPIQEKTSCCPTETNNLQVVFPIPASGPMAMDPNSNFIQQCPEEIPVLKGICIEKLTYSLEMSKPYVNLIYSRPSLILLTSNPYVAQIVPWIHCSSCSSSLISLQRCITDPWGPAGPGDQWRCLRMFTNLHWNECNGVPYETCFISMMRMVSSLQQCSTGPWDSATRGDQWTYKCMFPTLHWIECKRTPSLTCFVSMMKTLGKSKVIYCSKPPLNNRFPPLLPKYAIATREEVCPHI